MGKGKRNKEKRVQVTASYYDKKTKNKGGIPGWLAPVICVVVLVGVVAALVISGITSSGLVERNRMLIKSQEKGGYSLTQTTGAYLLWELSYNDAYQQWYTYYYYVNYFGVEDETMKSIVNTYTADVYALNVAFSNVSLSFRNMLEDEEVVKLLTSYVAVVDDAVKSGVKLDSDDKQKIKDELSWLDGLRTANTQSTTMDAFLKLVVGNGVKTGDVKKVAEMLCLYNKHYANVQNGLRDTVTPADLTRINEYLAAHPEEFYKYDYLTYAFEDKDAADAFETAFNAAIGSGKSAKEAFRELAAEGLINDNFKTIYSEQTVLPLANDALDAISNKTDDELTAALTENEMTAKEYTSADDTLDKALSEWLFSATNAQYATKLITGDDAYYVAIITEKMTKDGNVSKVTAAVKSFAFTEEGELTDELKVAIHACVDAQLLKEKLADAEDAAAAMGSGATTVTVTEATTAETVPQAVLTAVKGQKAGIYTADADSVYYVISVNSVETDSEQKTTSEITYVSFGHADEHENLAAGRADELLAKLKADGADKAALMKGASAISLNGSVSTAPTVVQNALKTEKAEVGHVFSTSEDGTYYVVHVTDIEAATDTAAASVKSIQYATYQKDDVYNEILDALEEKIVVPAAATAQYTVASEEEDAEEPAAYLLWLSEEARAADDFKVVAQVNKDEDGKETSTDYAAYLVVKAKYLDQDPAVNGAYLLVTDEKDADGKVTKSAAEIVNEYKEQLNGLTGSALVQKLYEISTSTAVSTAITEDGLTEDGLADWFFGTRTANEVGLVPVEGGTYIAIYLEKWEEWQGNAKDSLVSAQLTDWVDGMSEKYEINKANVDKVGELTTTAAAA